MADAILYLHPLESKQYTMDYQEVLPSTDSALANIDSGSTITAETSAGADAATILSGKTRTSKTLLVTVHHPVEGEEYTITFRGTGATSGQTFIKTLKVLGRAKLVGEF